MTTPPSWAYDVFGDGTEFHKATLAFVDENDSVKTFSGWVYEVPTNAGLERSQLLYHDSKTDRTGSTMNFITENDSILGGPNSSPSYKTAPVAESEDVFDTYHSSPGYYIVESIDGIEKSVSDVQSFYEE
jgi:hypothetical protein